MAPDASPRLSCLEYAFVLFLVFFFVFVGIVLTIVLATMMPSAFDSLRNALGGRL
jgi:phage shock protein PspC (stress-responsive transcriptional regulator)